MDLNTWFPWLFRPPGDFLLVLAGLLVLFGLVGGLTDSRTFGAADRPYQDDEKPDSSKPWWKRNEEPYGEWNARQVRKQHRIAGKHFAPD